MSCPLSNPSPAFGSLPTASAPAEKKPSPYEIGNYLVFRDARLARRWRGKRIPISVLYEAYFDGSVDIQNLGGLLAERNRFVSYRLTGGHLRWALTRFLPRATTHSRRLDQRLVRGHYDRGDDFFRCFLGDSMVYSAAYFGDPSRTVDEAQTAKLERVCRKLQLKAGERLLDLGCGWGALVAHAAQHYGVDATGVTLSDNQARFASERLRRAGLDRLARVLRSDYRDIPGERFDKIVSLEMVEHVGVRNLSRFFRGVAEQLTDEGVFLLQWTGLRRGLRPEDLVWGLFMNRYIFPGADASLCPSAMLRATERAGFEMYSLENVSIHYAWTIRKWRENWLRNRGVIVRAYGERWFRIWNFFLAWSTIIAAQGNGACMQVVLNKNLDDYDRNRWFPRESEAGR